MRMETPILVRGLHLDWGLSPDKSTALSRIEMKSRRQRELECRTTPFIESRPRNGRSETSCSATEAGRSEKSSRRRSVFLDFSFIELTGQMRYCFTFPVAAFPVHSVRLQDYLSIVKLAVRQGVLSPTESVSGPPAGMSRLADSRRFRTVYLHSCS